MPPPAARDVRGHRSRYADRRAPARGRRPPPAALLPDLRRRPRRRRPERARRGPRRLRGGGHRHGRAAGLPFGVAELGTGDRVVAFHRSRARSTGSARTSPCARRRWPSSSGRTPCSSALRWSGWPPRAGSARTAARALGMPGRLQGRPPAQRAVGRRSPALGPRLSGHGRSLEMGGIKRRRRSSTRAGASAHEARARDHRGREGRRRHRGQSRSPSRCRRPGTRRCPRTTSSARSPRAPARGATARRSSGHL